MYILYYTLYPRYRAFLYMYIIISHIQQHIYIHHYAYIYILFLGIINRHNYDGPCKSRYNNIII